MVNEVENTQNNLNAIKNLLILELYYSDVSVNIIAKASGMSTKTLYKFLPKKKSNRNK